MKQNLIILLMLLLGCSSFAQEMPIFIDAPDNCKAADSLDDAFEGENENGHMWRYGVDATTFFRDAEFFLPYTKGYTATGFFLNPYLKRPIGQHAQLMVGVHLAGVAGYDGIRNWQPLVRLEYEALPNWRIVMGSIYGTLAHGLFEPMFDRERYIYDHQEEGVQILGKLSFGPFLWQTDTWVHWEELLEPWQPTQERFTLGSNNTVNLLDVVRDESKLGVLLPLSFLGSHRGGQFTSLDTCIQTLFNENVGLRFYWAKHERKSLQLDLPLFFYQDMSPTKCMAYDKGWGVWPQLTLNSPLSRQKKRWHGDWQMQLQAGYWYGYQFIAPRGSYLFQSISWHDAHFAVPEREMLTAKVALENRYGKLSLGLDAEFYYDLIVNKMDMALGVYMRFRLCE